MAGDQAVITRRALKNYRDSPSATDIWKLCDEIEELHTIITQQRNGLIKLLQKHDPNYRHSDYGQGKDW